MYYSFAERPGIADPVIEISNNRRSLVFAASVAQAERMSNILNRHKPGSSAWVCGKTDKEERRNMLRDFAAGKLQYVVNVGCLTEGFDDPGVELIFMARPTKSRSLYAQMAGRAMRPAANRRQSERTRTGCGGRLTPAIPTRWWCSGRPSC